MVVKANGFREPVYQVRLTNGKYVRSTSTPRVRPSKVQRSLLIKEKGKLITSPRHIDEKSKFEEKGQDEKEKDKHKNVRGKQ